MQGKDAIEENVNSVLGTLDVIVYLSPLFVRPCQCPEKNVQTSHMRAFNKAVAVVFNSSGDDNCGLCDGLLVKATAVREFQSCNCSSLG